MGGQQEKVCPLQRKCKTSRKESSPRLKQIPEGICQAQGTGKIHASYKTSTTTSDQQEGPRA